MDHILLPKFNFNQLNWTSYCRFIELLAPEHTNFPFSMTNKDNYVNTVRFNKINVYFAESHSGGTGFQNLLILYTSSDKESLEHVQKMSKFLPYLRIPRLYIYIYNTEVTKFLLPKTYKKLHFLNVYSTADIDHAADIYYHEDIEFIRGYFMPNFTNEEWYSAMNYALNIMPAKECNFRRIKVEEIGTVEDLIKILEIPEVVKSITVEHLKRSPLFSCEEKWAVR